MRFASNGMNEDSVKEKIEELVRKYQTAKTSGKLRTYSEEETKKDFIAPLFEALGWDVRNKNEVSAEESQSGGRADYGFYINGRAKFYLEAKKITADLYRADFANQAVRYSWNKGVTWAVLTDFENIKVFNTQDIKRSLADKQFFDIHCDEYLKRFDELRLLSRDSFAEDLIDKEAERRGKKFQKVPISETLYKDLNECRDLLLTSLNKCNPGLDPDLLDEGVQKLLDRIIFLRVAEDRGIEPNILTMLMREAETRKGGETLFNAMSIKFRELDKVYNSNLFSPHSFEQWDEYDGATAKVVKILYGKPGYYEYDFKLIPADILGSVYEHYLAYRFSKSKRGLSLKEDTKKRKEQGIYYTPVFIVDYIVKNALGPVLDKCQSIEDLQKVKVLDPACGSGSFLLVAFQMILEKYKKMGRESNPFTKALVLSQNIYGVDLDEKAVEIAQLNLLLAAFDEKIKLPSLTANIKNGNSLISGSEEDLKKQFGSNFRDKKPFNWEEQFPDVFKQGGFDVVIGNPPYIKEFVNKSAFDGLHDSPYYQGKMDLWTLFACISIDLLKNGGTMSFIAPNNWVSNAGASIFRDKILRDGELKSFIDFGEYKVFEQAGIQTMVYVFEKKKPSVKYEVEYLRITNDDISEEKLIADILGAKQKVDIEPERLIGKNIIFSDSESGPIFDKLEKKKNFDFLDEEVGQGIVCPQEYVIASHLPSLKNVQIGDGIFVLKIEEIKSLNLDKQESKLIKPFYTSEQISRYYANQKNNLWIIYSDREVNKNIDKYPNIKSHLQKYAPIITSDFAPFGLHRARDEKFFKGPSIFSIRKTDKPQFSYVDFPCYVSQTYFVISTERTNLQFLTGILNSKVVSFWLKSKGKLQGNLLQIDKGPLLEIPIHVGEKEQQKLIINLVDEMLNLNKKLHAISKNSNEWQRLKSEIQKTDHRIDEEVYKLYGLTKEEIAIIEKI